VENRKFCSRVAQCGKASLLHAKCAWTRAEVWQGDAHSTLTERDEGLQDLSLNFSGSRFEMDGDVLGKFYGQATKGVRWMPWRQQAMKDVASCDKPRGAASKH
jgi:hypothetical protein